MLSKEQQQQRKLKLNMLRKQFPNLEIRYIPSEDMFEAFRDGKLIYGIAATNIYDKIARLICERSAKALFSF